ncbi:MAG TPA: HAMP domain-containing sensor histidine kinase [Chitinophagaceae bacterium]|nr:HAMP domain-containing sensor histidine kinase [Chitinophagaceae bacterium]
MSIRLKIALLFTLFVSGLLIISFWTVNTWLASKTKFQFQQRLKNRTVSIARLWSISDTLIQNVMNNLDSGSVASLKNKYVGIFDYNNKIHYQYADDSADIQKPPQVYIDKAKKNGEVFFSEGKRDGYIFRYSDPGHNILVTTIAFDEYRENVIQSLNNILWVIAAFGFLLSFLCGWLFSAYILKPVSRIVKEVNQVSSSNLSNRLSEGNTRDELSDLAKTFNQLLARLEESFIIQRRFISNASHELSTPLTSMSSQLQVALQKKRDTDDYAIILQSVLHEVGVMQELTKSLLEIARTGSEGAIELTDVRVDEALMKAVATVKKVYQGYEVNVQFHEFPDEEDKCTVPGNADLLYTAFKNIIENGCKYSEDRKINIDLRFSQGKIILDFVNKGEVMVEEEIEKIFQPFFRGSRAINKPGFGLGLPLTERIIKLHNGSLQVSSDFLKGTCFHIELLSKSAS